MMVTNQGRPLEVVFKPGAESDLNVLWSMELDLPDQAILYADGAYNCFDLEDILADEGVVFLAKRERKGQKSLTNSARGKSNR